MKVKILFLLVLALGCSKSPPQNKITTGPVPTTLKSTEPVVSPNIIVEGTIEKVSK